jgi:hypothetical protein
LPAVPPCEVLAPIGAWSDFTGESPRRNVSFRAGIFYLQNRIGGLKENVFNVRAW